MKVLFVVVNKMDYFEDLLEEFHERNLHGGTIFDTMGMVSMMSATGGIGHSIRGFLNKGRPFNKTIMMVVSDDEIQKVKDAFETVMGNLENENAGIIVAFPVSHLWGVKGHHEE